jgi:hypothetical protein
LIPRSPALSSGDGGFDPARPFFVSAVLAPGLPATAPGVGEVMSLMLISLAAKVQCALIH